MTMTAQIRDALAGGAKTFAELHGRTGGDDNRLKALLYYMQKSGEIKIGADEEKTVTLLRSGGGERVSRKGKKPAGAKKARRAMRKAKPKRKARTKRPYKRLAEKHATTNGAALHALALDNLVAAAQDLRRAISDMGELPEIGRAVRQYDLAEQIHDAAKNA